MRNLLSILHAILSYGIFLCKNGENNLPRPVWALSTVPRYFWETVCSALRHALTRPRSYPLSHALTRIRSYPLSHTAAIFQRSEVSWERALRHQVCGLLPFPREGGWERPLDPHQVAQQHLPVICMQFCPIGYGLGSRLEHIGGALHLWLRHPYWAKTFLFSCFEVSHAPVSNHALVFYE